MGKRRKPAHKDMYDRIAERNWSWTYANGHTAFDPKQARKFEKLLVQMIFTDLPELNDTAGRLFDLMLRALGRAAPYADYGRYAREVTDDDIGGSYAVMLGRQLLFLADDVEKAKDEQEQQLFDAALEATRVYLAQGHTREEANAFDASAFIQANIDYDLPGELVTYATIQHHNGTEEAGRRFVHDFLRLYWGETMRAMGLLDEVYFSLEHNAFAQGFSDKIVNMARKGKPMPPELDRIATYCARKVYTGDTVYANKKLHRIDGERGAYLHALRKFSYMSAWDYYNDHLDDFPFPENRQDPIYSMERLLDAHQQGLATGYDLLKDYFAQTASIIVPGERQDED